jgi:hypothetical protein
MIPRHESPFFINLQMPRRLSSELSIFSRKAMTAIQPVVAMEATDRNLPIGLEVSHTRDMLLAARPTPEEV